MNALSNDPEITGDIYSLLYELGIRANTTAFFQTACAVRLAVEQPQKLLLVTKWLYPEVAKHYHSNWKAVERNIRRTALAAWVKNPEQLELLAGQTLPLKPTPTQFLTILANHLRKKDFAA